MAKFALVKGHYYVRGYDRPPHNWPTPVEVFRYEGPCLHKDFDDRASFKPHREQLGHLFVKADCRSWVSAANHNALIYADYMPLTAFEVAIKQLRGELYEGE